MRKTFAVVAAVAVSAVAFSGSANLALAAKANSAYAQKKAECKQEAKAKHFGVHFVQRDRWIKNCIAGHRS
jgi:hypothetical protein